MCYLVRYGRRVVPGNCCDHSYCYTGELSKCGKKNQIPQNKIHFMDRPFDRVLFRRRLEFRQIFFFAYFQPLENRLAKPYVDVIGNI